MPPTTDVPTVPGNKVAECAAYFDGIAPAWEANFTPSGTMRNRLSRFPSALLPRLEAGAKVLDFGCGTGAITVACSSAGFEMTGVDRSRQMIKGARKNRNGRAIQFEALLESYGAANLPFPAKHFAAVIASSVLEYIPDPASCIKELNRVTIPGGWMIVTVPNPWHIIRIAENFASKLEPLVEPILSARLRSHLLYIRLSMNRFPVKKWVRLLQSQKWECVEVSGYRTPLLMIVSRKIA